MSYDYRIGSAWIAGSKPRGCGEMFYPESCSLIVQVRFNLAKDKEEVTGNSEEQFTGISS